IYFRISYNAKNQSLSDETLNQVQGDGTFYDALRTFKILSIISNFQIIRFQFKEYFSIQTSIFSG
ncbi:hypothetical protein J9332_26320, partial [Aquimarina celericrescens]|nr:hypothetical protein [Aquimarina celericrescens]